MRFEKIRQFSAVSLEVGYKSLETSSPGEVAPMQNESIHTVELTRQIRDKMYEETKDLASEEFLRYVKEHSEAARQRVHERTPGMQKA